MEGSAERRINSVEYWDGNARWYTLWLEHNDYHRTVRRHLLALARPHWRVLDIGGGTGVLALPLAELGCSVSVVEPSEGMQALLLGEIGQKATKAVTVDGRRWEDVPCGEYEDYDLVICSNSLHLMAISFSEALEKIARDRPGRVFVVAERPLTWLSGHGLWREYEPTFFAAYETGSSYAYHDLGEAWDHWGFKCGRLLRAGEDAVVASRLTCEEGHYWIKEKARVFMHLWERRDGRAEAAVRSNGAKARRYNRKDKEEKAGKGMSI